MKHSCLNAFLYILSLQSFVYALSIVSTSYTNISNDPEGSVHLNGLSFQQSPLRTFGSYQYVAYYATAPAGYGHHYVNLGRRKISPTPGAWESFAFTDYEQKTLDGTYLRIQTLAVSEVLHRTVDATEVAL